MIFPYRLNVSLEPLIASLNGEANQRLFAQIMAPNTLAIYWQFGLRNMGLLCNLSSPEIRSRMLMSSGLIEQCDMIGLTNIFLKR